MSFFLATASPAFAEEIAARAEASDATAEAAAAPEPEPAPAAGTIRLKPGETYTLRTETTTVAKPSVGGLYIDCLPELCAAESSGESPVPGVNWEGVRGCCSQGNLQCFWVDAGGRHMVTDDFFRCVTANTPSSPYVRTTAATEEPAPAKKRSSRAKPKKTKSGS